LFLNRQKLKASCPTEKHKNTVKLAKICLRPGWACTAYD